MQVSEQLENWLIQNQHLLTIQEMADKWGTCLSQMNKARNAVCEKHGLKKRKTYMTTPALPKEPGIDQRKPVRGVYSNSSPYGIARPGFFHFK